MAFCCTGSRAPNAWRWPRRVRRNQVYPELRSWIAKQAAKPPLCDGVTPHLRIATVRRKGGTTDILIPTWDKCEPVLVSPGESQRGDELAAARRTGRQIELLAAPLALLGNLLDPGQQALLG